MKKRYVQLLIAVIVFMSSPVGSAQNQQKFIKFDSYSKISTNNANQIIKQYYNLSSNDNFILTKSESDMIGFTHDKYQQYYKGIEVKFGIVIVHSRNGIVKIINGDAFNVENINITPNISKSRGFQYAVNHIGATAYLWDNPKEAKLMGDYKKPEGKLVILPDFKHKYSKQQSAKLAYCYDIYATNPVSRSYIYIDAHTGKFLYQDNIILHTTVDGIADTRYYGTKTIKTDNINGSYRLRDYSRGNGIETYNMHTGTNYYTATDFIDNDNYWSSAEYDNSEKDNAALDAHYGAQMTYDYWITKHNFNSYDGNGAKIKSYVHYGVAYENAFWNGSVLTYGDGNTHFDALTPLDVVGHEFGHAICSSTANLTYSYESGALNEGFSDIWGASVEYFADPTLQTWLIGEAIERRAGHMALRSMSEPNSEGQPDTYHGTYWYFGSNDHGGVHTNSGVLNYWYYLLSVGGSGTNDNYDSYTVTGITIDKAAQIAFRAERYYLSPNSNYADMRTAGIQSAIDLYGAGSIEEIATTNAFYAVGIGSEFAGCPNDLTITQDVFLGQTDIQESSHTITLQNIIFSDATAEYDAGQTVYLKPNFHAKHGSSFRAYIEGCQSATYAKNASVVSYNNTDIEERNKEINREVNKEEFIKVFPNPTKGELKIQTTKEVESWKITNVYGNSFFKGKSTKNINISNLPKGIYVLKAILNNGKVVIKRIIKE